MLKIHYMQSSSLSHFAFENQRRIINFCIALNDVFLSLFWLCFVFFIYIKEYIYLAKI